MSTRTLSSPSLPCTGSTGSPRTPSYPPLHHTGATVSATALAPLPPLQPVGHFDMWRDYLGLAALLSRLLRDPPCPGDPPAVTVALPGPPCAFCRHNGEAPAVYRGHSLRDASGRLQCPVLRSYVCPQCGATQDRAHTRRFCPLTHHGYVSLYTRPARHGDTAGTAGTGGKRAARNGRK
ncbi:Nanos 3 [Willisornis vidua]|uniref:Nanos 3 n=1 Tax=Willisornis vidua TaxID=1566151 RepID=A0ABQ9DV12_9PASS|nr:Nanos 3 [Willisornis vidua]